MELIGLIVLAVASWFSGYGFANIRRLKVVGRELKALDIKDPAFMDKIEIIRKFNYMA